MHLMGLAESHQAAVCGGIMGFVTLRLITGILILRPLKGGGLFIMGPH